MEAHEESLGSGFLQTLKPSHCVSTVMESPVLSLRTPKPQREISVNPAARDSAEDTTHVPAAKNLFNVYLDLDSSHRESSAGASQPVCIYSVNHLWCIVYHSEIKHPQQSAGLSTASHKCPLRAALLKGPVSCVRTDEAEQRGGRRRGGDLDGQLV